MELKFQNEGKKIVQRGISKGGSQIVICKMMQIIPNHGQETKSKQGGNKFQLFGNPLFDLDVELTFHYPLDEMHVDSIWEEQFFSKLIVSYGGSSWRDD